MKHVTVLLTLGLTMAPASTDLPKIARGSEIVAEFPSIWMHQMSFAYADFRSIRKDVSCFVMKAYRSGTNYHIVFVDPKGDIQDSGGGSTIPIVPGSGACGRAVRYEFDEVGNFVRRVSIR